MTRVNKLFFLKKKTFKICAFTNIKTPIHKQSDVEQLPEGEANLYSVQESNPQHSVQQPIAQRLDQRGVFLRDSYPKGKTEP